VNQALAAGETKGLPDVEAFLACLERLDRHPVPEARSLFEPGGELVVARAPGRLDVMGGIADYSGSLVLQLPIREATLVALQRDPEPRLHIVSLDDEARQGPAAFELSLAALEADGAPLGYAAARALFRDPGPRWAAYVAGAFLALRRERGIAFGSGARMLVSSAVPAGKGVSSSAALEIAAMQAIAAAFELPLAAREQALLAHRVENEVAGAPCGVMDQMTAACGEAGRLLALLCQPAELLDAVALPEDLAVWGIDSGERHAVSGSDYASVRVGAFMGYRLLAERAGLHARVLSEGRVEVDDPLWRGYLANVGPSELGGRFAGALPESLAGAEFLARYAGTTDPVTRVDAARAYAVRAAAEHPVFEHFRVRAFAELLAGPATERRRELLGELMYQSHASYGRCGLGSPGTDRLVELVRAAGPRSGLYGARITGGGSGGTVAVLGARDAGAGVAAVAARYRAETGRRPQVFSGSSPGAGAFGTLRVRA
jgi:L-arabinokinase